MEIGTVSFHGQAKTAQAIRMRAKGPPKIRRGMLCTVPPHTSGQAHQVAERQSDTAANALPRRLGLVATTAIVVGTIVGSGIFRVPATVADQVGSAEAVVAVWVLGGVISLCGALSLAELAAALPR